MQFQLPSLQAGSHLINRTPRYYCHSYFRTFSSRSRARNLDILGLSENATAAEVKAAYLTLSKQWHPDINKSHSATEEFQKIKLAYEQLQGDQLRSATTSSSTERDERHNNEKYTREFQSWKVRQKRTKEFDDWLRKVQNEGREKVQRGRFHNSDEELKSNYSKSDFSKSRQRFSKFEFEERNENVDTEKSGRDEAYLRYEKNFIARLDHLLDLRRKLNPEYKVQDNIHRPRDVYLAIFAPFLWRLLIKSAVYISMLIAGISSILGWTIEIEFTR